MLFTVGCNAAALCEGKGLELPDGGLLFPDGGLPRFWVTVGAYP